MGKTNLMLFFAMFAIVAGEPSAADIHKDAVVVTWHNKSGTWFAIGPLQLTAGYGSEQEAINAALDYQDRNSKPRAGDPDNVSDDHKYNVYRLHRKYEKRDIDVHEYVKSHFNFYLSD